MYFWPKSQIHVFVRISNVFLFCPANAPGRLVWSHERLYFTRICSVFHGAHKYGDKYAQIQSKYRTTLVFHVSVCHRFKYIANTQQIRSRYAHLACILPFFTCPRLPGPRRAPPPRHWSLARHEAPSEEQAVEPQYFHGPYSSSMPPCRW